MKTLCLGISLVFSAIAVLAQTTVTTSGGTVNSIPKFTGSSTIGNSAITDNNGLVGIGTTNPQSFLDIEGNSGVTFAITAAGENSLLFGTQGSATMGASLTSSSGFSTCYNGVFLDNNGTGRGDVGSQKNTALPSWRMSLGSGTCEWGGGDNFAIGRVAAGGNYLAPTILFKVSNLGGLTAPGSDGLTFGTILCCAATGPTGSILASSAGFSSAYNGTFLNNNGSGRGDTGAQMNTTLPSWRMSLGSGSQEWGGGDNFAIGRVAPGANYLAPSILLKVDNAGAIHPAGGITFADGSSQTTAQLIGPPGPQGPTGATGPQGPQGLQGPPGPQITTTYRAFCAGAFGSSDSVVLNPLGQTAFPNCWLVYNGFTVRYVPEFGNGSQSGDFPIYIDSPNNTTVDTQYGFAVPRAGTLTNLRASAITHGSSSTSGKVFVRKIHTNNTVDNTSSDILLSCTVGTGTSCSDTTHTLSISAGERILVTVQTAPNETLASISVLVDLQ